MSPHAAVPPVPCVPLRTKRSRSRRTPSPSLLSRYRKSQGRWSRLIPPLVTGYRTRAAADQRVPVGRPAGGRRGAAPRQAGDLELPGLSQPGRGRARCWRRAPGARGSGAGVRWKAADGKSIIRAPRMPWPPRSSVRSAGWGEATPRPAYSMRSPTAWWWCPRTTNRGLFVCRNPRQSVRPTLPGIPESWICGTGPTG